MDSMLIAEKIIKGFRLDKVRDKELCMEMIQADADTFTEGADHIRAAFSGDRVDLCTIINGRSGLCGEDCKFCAQAACHNTGCERYEFMDEELILEAAASNEEEGVDRFAIVTSGKSPSKSDFEKTIKVYSRMNKELNIKLCASLGFLTEEQFARLKDAGVSRYHCNIETSRRFFPEICSTHSFDEKLENIRRAKNAGLSVCSGGIIGMGESWEDRIDMAFTLKELNIRSIPLNSLVPVPGTPLEGLPRLSENDILRTIAIFRYINPEADIRLAGGRALMENNGRKAFESGASATITGNMLTTCGSTIRKDREMLLSLGRMIG